MAPPNPPRQNAPRAERFEPSAEQWKPNRWTAELGPALVAAVRKTLRSGDSGRPAHRHGVVWRGRFRPSGDAAELSDFAGFRGAEFQALTRFSNLRRRLGEPDIMGMATKLLLPDGETTDLVAMNLDVFPVQSSHDFLALLEALQHGPVRSSLGLATMVATRRASARALARALLAARKRRYPGHTTFHGVQTFRLVRAATPGMRGERRPVRYRWVPPDDGRGRGRTPRPHENGQMRFTLEVVLGNSGWPRTDDPTWRWPRDAPTVRAGELTLYQLVEPDPEQLAFNPGVLASGIEPGDDDIFSDRAGAYAVAHVSRTGPTTSEERRPHE